ncbi:hypothetical protein A6R68_14096 [Neotoma lepida]|uniref:Pan3 C-terminal knob domain-containing protein n=1 Tax=Neotoma lepida TaxID=56216 RepID=A0A1A6HAS3_NEOLE|nr:hypothetical protein A6R68_14096 [Neotoma lepida]
MIDKVIQKETVGGTTYFYTDTTPAPVTGMVFPNYHIYPPTAPHVAYMQPKANAPSFFMADELRQVCFQKLGQTLTIGYASEQEEGSLVFAYDFHAGGETMMSRHFNDPNADAYFTKRKWAEFCSAYYSYSRFGVLRVNCVGVFDVLTFDNSQNNNPLALMAQYQQADLISLGKVVLALACNSLAGIQRENLQKAMELVTINYSSDLKNLILYLLTDQNRMRSVNDIMPMIGARFYTQLDAAQMRNDVIEEDLAKQSHCPDADIRGVCCQVGIAVKNTHHSQRDYSSSSVAYLVMFQKDPTWSETGDRYLLKLFRDHLFHQVTEAGAPWIDLSHIISCLNKLDAGVPEKISLISRDEKSVLVVTYSDLKRCFENTFQELIAAANGQL